MKNILNTLKQNYRLFLAVLASGLILGWLFFNDADHSRDAKNISNADDTHKGHDHSKDAATTWTCSMHPQIKQDKPGKCPICAMDLIPLSKMTSQDQESDPNELVMSPSTIKLADIQTIKVKMATPEKTLILQGKVEADERNIAELTARFAGRIEKLFVNFTGQSVRKGQKLATIYSPKLVTAQRELIEAVAMKKEYPSLYNAAKRKLKLWDITDSQIDKIEKKGKPQPYFNVLSPISGTVTVRHVALGDYINKGETLFKITNLSTLWVMFDAYESDLPWIKINDVVNFNIEAVPGKQFTAKVSYIDPVINPKTRVAKVRVVVANNEMELKPHMFAKAVVESKLKSNTHQIMIPKTAVLWTGKRSIVYIKVPNRTSPSFLFREITLGAQSGDYFMVEEGLSEGEEIAINGVFKIDAAAQLMGLPSMMNPKGGAAPTGHDHTNIGDKSMNTQNPISVNPSQINKKFKSQLSLVYKEYLNITKAFVASDPQKVKTSALMIIEKLNKTDMTLLKGDAHMLWMKLLPGMKNTLQTITNNTDIQPQRNQFAKFNTLFYQSIKSFGLSGVTTYYQFCPMANDDKGAYWFSDSQTIENPYFGDAMLNCGEIKETIK